MTKFNIIFFILALTLASGIMVSFAQETKDTEFPPESAMPPETAYTKYLDECARKVEEECGKEIFFGMFESLPVTQKCCLQLVKMGKTCHDDLAKAIVKLPEYAPKASVALPKSVLIWDACVLVTK
ncbi:protein DOWN-REGULATED IN DIF1 11-like [Fagus crenata]